MCGARGLTRWTCDLIAGLRGPMLDEREDGLGQKYRADVCVESSDQHRGWFQSQLLTAVGSGSSSIPYKGSHYTRDDLGPEGGKDEQVLG